MVSSTYKISIRQPKQWFFRSYEVEGQVYNGQKDKLILIFANKHYREIPNISQCEVKYDEGLIIAQNKVAKEAKEKQENADLSRVQK